MKHIYYHGLLSVKEIVLPLEEFKLQRKKVREGYRTIFCVVFGAILLLMFVGFTLWSIPAVNIYRSIETGEVVKVETREGSVTNPSRIKEVLSGRYDGVTYYVP